MKRKITKTEEQNPRGTSDEINIIVHCQPTNAKPVPKQQLPLQLFF